MVYFWRELVGLCHYAVASTELSGNDQEVSGVVDDLTNKRKVKLKRKMASQTPEAEALATFETPELSVSECVSLSATSLPNAGLPSSVNQLSHVCRTFGHAVAFWLARCQARGSPSMAPNMKT